MALRNIGNLIPQNNNNNNNECKKNRKSRILKSNNDLAKDSLKEHQTLPDDHWFNLFNDDETSSDNDDNYKIYSSKLKTNTTESSSTNKNKNKEIVESIKSNIELTKNNLIVQKLNSKKDDFVSTLDDISSAEDTSKCEPHESIESFFEDESKENRSPLLPSPLPVQKLKPKVKSKITITKIAKQKNESKQTFQILITIKN
jgi:hypothetical protein